MTFYDALNWRYATKKMNGNVVPDQQVNQILEAIQLAPTSMGVQPFTVFVITDPKIKEQIKSVAYNQTQITDSSHLLVFAAWDQLTDEHIDAYIQQIADERNLDLTELAPLRNNIETISDKSQEELFTWSARQAYIAFGFGIAAAAIEQVDATPMEGFNNEALDELLDLREKGMRSTTILPLGFRDEENDWLAPMKKVRRPKEKLFVQVQAESEVLVEAT